MSVIKKVIIIICSFIFILMSSLYLFNHIGNFDLFFYNIIIYNKNDTLTYLLRFVTMLGGGIGTILVIMLITIRNRKKGISLLFNLAVITLLNLILKNLFVRQRPIDINIITETGYSFPSGHSMIAVANYGLIIYYLYHSNFSKKLKSIFIAISFLTMALIPISRVYLGVHFFSDIIAGSCISAIWLIIYTQYFSKYI